MFGVRDTLYGCLRRVGRPRLIATFADTVAGGPLKAVDEVNHSQIRITGRYVGVRIEPDDQRYGRRNHVMSFDVRRGKTLASVHPGDGGSIVSDFAVGRSGALAALLTSAYDSPFVPRSIVIAGRNASFAIATGHTLGGPVRWADGLVTWTDAGQPRSARVG